MLPMPTGDVDAARANMKMHAVQVEDLELTQLRLLEALAETGRLASAAEKAGLSESAASHSLGRLRRATGDALFVRTAGGMQPTPYGRQLCAASLDALTLLREALESGRDFDPMKSERTFTIYMSEAGQLVILPRLVAFLRQHAPKVRVHVSRIPEKDRGDALASGEVDLAIGHITTMTTGFHQRRLFSEHYVCLTSLDCPLFRSGVTLDAYRQALHAIADSSGMAHWMIDQQLRQHDVVRRVGLVVPEFLALPFVVLGSDLMVTIPSRLAERFAKVLPLRVTELPIALDSYEVLLFWHERVHADTANRWMRQALATLLRP
jgi:DNA-binding transcriptional LysR family regulator